MYRPHTNCRACGFGPVPRLGKAAIPTERLIPVLDLGVQPLANDFRKPGEERSGYSPLQVLLCPKCNLAQLSVTVRPDILYSNYPYVTSPTPMMKDHFNSLARELKKEAKILTVIEVGSNDGAFLKFWREQGAERVLGIEPADNLVGLARADGIDTLHGLFDLPMAKMASTSCPAPDLVIARHVFCHIDDWQAFISHVSLICSKETLVAIEVPYVMDMMEKGSFDQVYHEHLSYLNVKAVQHLLDGSAMRLQKVLRFPIHGGAIVLLLRRRDSEVPIDPSVMATLEAEKCGPDEWITLEIRARDQITSLRSFVCELAQSGKRICGHGASAKATVWINACGFTRKEIQYVMDSTAWKVGSTIPGTDIPVVHEGTHIFDSMDYSICFAWNFLEHLLTIEKQFMELGGKLIVPIPEIKILPSPP